MGIDANTASLVKDKAENLFSKGRFMEALDAYEKIRPYGEKDPRVYLRIGDIARKVEDGPRAVESYKKAALSFARLGFAIKAIAVCKMILAIDPSQEEFQADITSLCSGGNPAPRPEPSISPGPEAMKKAGSGEVKKTAQGEAPVEQPDEGARLPRVPLFSELSEAEFLDVVKKARSRTVADGEYLFREGDGGDSIFFIAEGEMTPVGKAKDGSEVALARLAEGGVFGEFGFFSNARRSTGVKASKKTVVLELTKADLDDVISRHGRVEEILFDFYKERVVDRLMALSSVFMPMKEEDRKEILKRLTLVRFDKGSLIVQEGLAGDTMYLIKEGRVSVWVKGKSGAARVLADLKEGDFFGEIALATNKPRVASVTALEPVALVEFSRPVIKDVLSKYPEIKGILAGVIKERVSDVISAKEGRAVLL